MNSIIRNIVKNILVNHKLFLEKKNVFFIFYVITETLSIYF